MLHDDETSVKTAEGAAASTASNSSNANGIVKLQKSLEEAVNRKDLSEIQIPMLCQIPMLHHQRLEVLTTQLHS